MEFTFGVYPKPSARKADVFEILVRGIMRQQSYLDSDRDSDLNPKDRGHWYRVVDGTYYCWLYISNVKLDLNNDGGKPIIAHNREEAKKVYEQLIEEVEAGKYNELVKEHLAKIPPRKKRTGGESHDD